MLKDQKEICTIRIMFEVETDEQAINYKRLIQDILKDKPEAQIQFMMMSSPPKAPPMG